MFASPAPGNRNTIPCPAVGNQLTGQGESGVYCTAKPNGAVVPLGVVTVMVYTWVPLLTGSVVGMVQFQRS
jgi:hypothetical protein